MKPSIGKIIHVRALDGSCVPAIVTKVHGDGAVNACVFRDPEYALSLPNLPIAMRETLQGSGDMTPGTWHWPEIEKVRED